MLGYCHRYILKSVNILRQILWKKQKHIILYTMDAMAKNKNNPQNIFFLYFDNKFWLKYVYSKGAKQKIKAYYDLKIIIYLDRFC